MVSQYHSSVENDTNIKYLQRECLVHLVYCVVRDSEYSGEIDRLKFYFNYLDVTTLTQRIHCIDVLEFAENMTFVSLCLVNRGIVREKCKMSPRCRGSIIYV
jgi:hypothetical protein